MLPLPTLPTTAPALDSAQRSITGPVRPNNEDYLGWAACAGPRGRGWLFALADGVGGAADGEVAARAAVEYLLRQFVAPAARGGEEAPRARLGRLVREANHHVFDLGQGRMATTLVACCIWGGEAVIAHAGDSRCYLVRDGRARALTRDHLRRGGSWRPWRPAAPPRLERALGADLFLTVALRRLELEPGDVLALTSDGLHGSVSAGELARCLAQGPGLEQAAQALVALAEARDGSDNISLVLVRIPEASGA
ncbi:MAG TPA: protein phosphatase 2C domain-containing protein [Terriglobales bacterium]|jgi:protein phosphatase